MKKILITSALPYANGPLHFGHIAGAYLPGDCYARYERLKKNDVLYICGSDEYGVAITMSAEIANRSPQEHVDIFHKVNLELFQKLNFSFDHFSRTTWNGHIETAQEYFKDLLANGYIEEKVTDQLYSEEDKKFLADRYVVGTCPKCGYENARGDECPQCGASYEATDLKNPRSKLTDSPLTLKPTKHWFLLLDKFKDRLIEWIGEKNWKPNVVNFVKGYINELRPRAITRDSKWGIPIPLPNTEGKVLYVWFDAPIGYISATMEWSQKIEKPDEWKRFWCDPETKLVNFIGKDNIPFHAAIFPAMTMGQNQPYKVVDELPANEFYKLEGKQFSKTEGWSIDLEDFFERYTADQIRYTIASNAPETSDSEFTWNDFQTRCNGDLLGKYGNLVNRVLVFAKKHCGGTVPEIKNLEKVDDDFLQSVNKLVDKVSESYEAFRLRRASRLMMELAQLGNVYFDNKQPWKDNQEGKEVTIACCLECLKALALVSVPIIPETASKVWKLIGFQSDLVHGDWEKIKTSRIPSHQKLLEPKILFQKIEDEQIESEIQKLHVLSGGEEFEPIKEQIDIKQFEKLDLRVAEIVSASPVPKSDKLLQIQVDLGFEKRTVVSGISQHYSPDDLIGKKVVLVANLKPVKIRGVKSQGMILCGTHNEDLEVLELQNIPSGKIIR